MSNGSDNPAVAFFVFVVSLVILVAVYTATTGNEVGTKIMEIAPDIVYYGAIIALFLGALYIILGQSR